MSEETRDVFIDHDLVKTENQKSQKSQKRKVLVIDDDEDILKIISLTLKEDFIVNLSTNGMDGLAIAVGWKPDLIILDWMMPKLAGHQVVHILKRKDETQSIPILFISAKKTDAAKNMVKRLGVTEYITKPFDPQHILDSALRIVNETDKT